MKICDYFLCSVFILVLILQPKHFSKLTSQLYKLQNAFTQLDLEDKDNYENDSQGEPASSVQVKLAFSFYLLNNT